MNKRTKTIFSLLLTVAMIFGMIPVFTFFNEQPPFTPSAYAASSVWDGNYDDGSDCAVSGNTVHIYSARGFAYFAKQVQGTEGDNQNTCPAYENYTIYLECDIDLNNIPFSGIGLYHNWTQSGCGGGDRSDQHYFAGTFDGQGHTISNLKINADEQFSGNGNNDRHRIALFRHTKNTTIKNLTLSNVNIIGASDKNGTSALVGFHQAGSLTIENVHVAGGTVSGYNYVGGLVGEVYENSGGTLSLINCSNSANITCTNVRGGGLVGSSLPQVNAQNCVNSGNVTGTSTDM